MRDRRNELLAVGALFLAVAAYLGIQAARVNSYVWLVDELLYTKAAQSFDLGSLHPHVLSEPASVPNALYTWLLAVPYALFSNTNAFHAAHILDALIFSSTVVPVYLTARVLGARPGFALLGAALAVLVPWSVAAMVLMSESLAYASFAWAVLAMTVAIARPGPRNDVLALVALGVASYARTQFLALFLVFGVALVLHELTFPGDARAELRERVRSHWVLGAVLAIAGLAALVVQPAVLGSYGNTAHVARLPPGLSESMAGHLGRIVIGCGIVPVLLWAAWAVRSAIQPRVRAEHAFAWVSGLAAFAIVYQAAFFSRQIAGGEVQERYAFYIVALFAAGAAAMLADRRRPGPVGSLVVPALVALPLVGAASWPERQPTFQIVASAASGFGREFVDWGTTIGSSWTTSGALAVTIVAVALIAVAALNSGTALRFAAPALGALTLVFCVVETQTVLGRAIPGINSAYPGLIGSLQKSWVDGALSGSSDEAGAIEGYVEGRDQGPTWLWTEFWNTRVARVYEVAGRPGSAAGLPTTPMSLDLASGRLATPHPLPLLVVPSADVSLGIQGQLVRPADTGQILIRTGAPYRAAWVFADGSGTTDLTSAWRAFSVYPPDPGKRAATVGLDVVAAASVKHPLRWVARVAGGQVERGVVGPGGRSRLTIRAEVAPGAQRAIVQIATPDEGAGTAALFLRNPSVTWSA